MKPIEKGLELQQIAYGIYDIQLSFRGDLHFTTGYILIYIDPQGVELVWSNASAKNRQCINEILGLKISSTKFRKDGIQIVFDNGSIINLPFEGKGNESVIVNWRGEISVNY